MPSVISGAHSRLRFPPAPVRVGAKSRIPPCPSTWQAWRSAFAASYAHVPDAPRHVRVWEWFAALAPGARPRPLVSIWPRGGGKSTTIELGVTYAGHAGKRKFVLYVCETQAQADKHLQSISTALERIGIGRAVNVYNNSKGWSQKVLRTASGFNVVSLGLDAASRGVKLDEYRPDLIVFDDVDGRHDTPETTRRKIETITETIIPSGSAQDCAIVFVQNLVHADSIAAQLADGRAGFLADREPVAVEPALRDLTYETVIVEGQIRTTITGGVSTWEGQSLADCQRIVNDSGIEAFLRECQHDVERPEGQIYGVFDPAAHVYLDFPIPDDWPRYVGWDFGGTNTAAVLLAEEPGTGVLHLYAEYLGGDRTAAEHVAEVLGQCPTPPFCAGGSGSEGQWRREFRAAGLAIADPGVALVEIGLDRVRAVLKAGGLRVARSCAGIIGQFRTYREEVDAAGRRTGKIQNKHAYHFLDALRYILVRVRRGGPA